MLVRRLNELRQYIYNNHHFSESQFGAHKKMQLYKTYFKPDAIPRFSLRPPELMTIVDMVGKYYRSSNVSSKPLKDDLVIEFIDEDLKKPT